MRLLVTRPEPDGERTAAALRARRHDVTVSPLMSIAVIRDANFGSGHSALLMTSANAARAVAENPRRKEITALPVFTVGRHTAEAAKVVGFTDIRSADGNAADLAQLVQAQLANGGPPILYLAGEDRARDLAGDLTTLGLPVDIVVVYRAELARAFPAPVRTALAAGMLDGVLHFSRRSVEAFLRCAGASRQLDRALPLIHFCLSQEVAELLIAVGASNVRVASRPDESVLLDLIDQN